MQAIKSNCEIDDVGLNIHSRKIVRVGHRGGQIKPVENKKLSKYICNHKTVITGIYMHFTLCKLLSRNYLEITHKIVEIIKKFIWKQGHETRTLFQKTTNLLR